jgi:hypothetical protein
MGDITNVLVPYVGARHDVHLGNFALYIGPNTPIISTLNISGTMDPTGIIIEAVGNSTAANIKAFRARGTPAAKAAVQTNDILLLVGAEGYGATAYAVATRASIKMLADEMWSDTANGTRFGIFTTALGTTTTSEVVSIYGDGHMNVVSYVKTPQVRTPEIKTDEVTPTDLTITTGANKTALLGTVVYNDLVLPLIVRTTGAGRPSLAVMIGTIEQYRFAVGDNAEIEATEILHGWKEGTPVEFHIHWVTGGLNNATVRGVKWQIEYSWANPTYEGGTTVFGATTLLSAEDTIAANEPALTHHYTNIGTFTPTGGKLGAFLILRLTRIASVTHTAPAANPFGLAAGVHYQIDTIGSRLENTK